MNDRTQRLVRKLKADQLPALMVTDANNRRYLSGFSGSAGTCVVTYEEAYLLTDFRYTDQATQQAPDYQVITYKKGLQEGLSQLLEDLEVDQVGFEADDVTYRTYSNLCDELGDIEWAPTSGIIEKLRQVKDDEEVQIIREAAQIADEAFEEILPSVRPGRTESEVALDLEFCMRRLGAEELAFGLIVASGVRSSLPHGRASEKVIGEGEFVTFDYGAAYCGYCSDATRTVITGEPTEKQREVYDTVLRAQKAAVEFIEPGRTGEEVDRVARDIIAEAGYGDNFGHGLGHGVGLAVHEGPRLSQQNGDTELAPGMVVTVEPGIYISGWGGVRIEDLVMVTEDGAEVLTSPTKDLVVQKG